MPADSWDHGDAPPPTSEQLLDALCRLGQMLADAEGGSDMFAFSASVVAQATGAKDVFVATSTGIRSGPHGDEAGGVHRENAQAAVTKVLKTGEPVWSEALWAMPVFVKGTPMGALVVVGSRWVGEGALVWLRAVANLLSSAMQAEAAAAMEARFRRDCALLEAVVGDCAELEAEPLMQSVVGRVRQTLGASLSALLYANEGDEFFVCAVSHSPQVAAPASGTRTIEQGLVQRAMATGRPQRGAATELGYVNALPASEPRPSFAMAAPLFIRQQGVAAMTLTRSTPFDDDEMRLLSVVCGQMTGPVDSARLQREASHRHVELEVVRSAAEGLARLPDANALVDFGVERLCRVLGCEVASVYLLEDGVFELVHQYGMTPAQQKASRRTGSGEPLIGDALAAGAAIDRKVDEVGEPTRAFLSELGLERVAAAPLLIVRPGERDSPGVVLLGRRNERVFPADELRMIAAVTSQLCVALQNAWLFEETRRRMEEMSIVVDAGGALARSTMQRDTLDAIAHRLASLLKVQSCSILITDEENLTLVTRGTTCAGGSAGLAAVKIDLRSDALGAVAARTGQVQHLTKPATNAFVAERAASDMPSFITAVPLVFSGRVVAVLYVSDNDPSRRLKPSELERLQALGSQMAVAIERTRLFNAFETSLAELATTQRELVKSERLAALGEMSALVAHEIRNPLGVIFNALGSLGRLVPLSGDARTVFEILREEAHRLNRIVGDMLDYTRPLRPSLLPIPVELIVGDAIESATGSERLRGTPVDDITIERHATGQVPALRVDEQLAHQALVNLLTNAMQAAGAGGLVRVSTSLHQQNDEAFARIEIEDDGAGFPKEVRERLFEPFVTTKATGSGLGLAVVRRVMDAHDGRVSLVDRDGGGTVFRLEFPVPHLKTKSDET